MANLKSSKFHIAMFPWFAFGHMTPYLHLSNKLAERGHTVSFLLPRGAQPKIEQLSLHPHLIHFFPLDVPHVDGLPPGVETASDVPLSSHTHLATAFDQTRDQLETILTTLLIKPPNFIFFDFGCWVPVLATDLGIKSIYYAVVSAATHARALVPSFKIEKNWTPAQLVQTPPGYPSPMVKLKEHEAGHVLMLVQEMGSGLTLYERLTRSMKECDAIAMRTCSEIEGPFCDYIAQQYNKPVHLTGHVLPDNTQQPERPLEEPWAKWLSKFKPKSVVYCALGSQFVLNKEQFQEMVLGFELTQLPFLVALKPPQGCETVEEALPDGFKERVEGRGLVHGGWVPQPGILRHQSVGCFVSHCGYGSMWESLLSECQIVLVPDHLGDHITIARLMVENLKVAVEVEKEKKSNNSNNGKWWFTKDSLCKAIKCMMDEESKIGCELKSNHAKRKDIVSMETGYIDSFVQKLQNMLD